MTIQFLSPAETSQRLGVSVRALRLYERRGLVMPQRTSAGWRVYGPDQIARLHQVLALKSLGLPLMRIGELINGRQASLDAVLALQEHALDARKAETERALKSIRCARSRLAAGQTLSLDDLTTLARETQMTDKMTGDQWRDAFEPLWRKHFSPAEYDQVLAHKTEALRSLGGDPAEFGRAWDQVIADATRLMQAGDAASPKAREVLERWRALSNRITKADPELNAKAVAVWQEALSDPLIAPHLQVGQDLWAFMKDVARRADAA